MYAYDCEDRKQWALSAWEFLEEYACRPQEASCVIALDGPHKDEVILVALGAANQHHSPSSLWKETAASAGATHIVMCHNHPWSASPRPSVLDISAAYKIMGELRESRVFVEDFLIVSGRGWLSFADIGLFGLCPASDNPLRDMVTRLLKKAHSLIWKVYQRTRAKLPVYVLQAEATRFNIWEGAKKEDEKRPPEESEAESEA